MIKLLISVKPVADPGFPGGVHPLGGRVDPLGGVDPRCGNFSPKMCAKMKELGPVGRGVRQWKLFISGDTKYQRKISHSLSQPPSVNALLPLLYSLRISIILRTAFNVASVLNAAQHCSI